VLHLVQQVNLLRALSQGFGMLLPEADKGALVLDVRLLKVFPELGQHCLPLLVELDLSCRRASCLIQPVPQTFHLPDEVRPLPLCLCSCLPLSLKLLFHLLHTPLTLLDALLHLRNQALLVLQLSAKTSDLRFLPCDGGLQLLLAALEVGRLLLGDPQLTLHLPSLLVYVDSSFLLLVKRTLQLVQSRFQFEFHFQEVIHLIRHLLQVVRRFCTVFSHQFLLLVQFVDGGVLIGDLIVEGPYYVVFVCLLLLKLSDDKFYVSNVFLHNTYLLFLFLLLVCCLDPLLLSSNKFVLGCS